MNRFLYSSLLISSLVLGIACVGGKPISDGQGCPCAAGWTCDTAHDVCVADGGAAGTGGPGAAGTGSPGAAGTASPGAAGTGDGEDYTPPDVPGCGATCGTPAGEVQAIATSAASAAIIRGRWEFCDGAWQRGINAPSDAIGVEFGPATRTPAPNGGPTLGGKMYYLVASPSGPKRGAGFAYQLTYNIPDDTPETIVIHPMPNSGAWVRIRYSACPVELEVAVFYDTTPGTMTRFSPGSGYPDGGADALPEWDGGSADAGVPTYSCAAMPAGTPNTCGEAPRSLFGWTNPMAPTTDRYALGCTVVLPVENPYSPGPRQSCECSTAVSATPSWLCAL